MSPSPTLLILLFAILLFGFLDGFHTSASVVATVISSRAMRARHALWLAAVAELVGPFLFGVAIAQTIGRDLADPSSLTAAAVLTAVLSSILWKLFTWWRAIPSSPAFSLVGGLVGAVLAGSGASALSGPGLVRILLSLVGSPIVGLLAGYLIMRLTLLLVQGATPRINLLFKRAQLLTTVGLALSHGTNDGQKIMALIGLAMVTTGMVENFDLPLWVVAISAAVLSLGTLTSGMRIIRTVGGRFYKIRPVHSFAAQTTAGLVILTAALLGGPVSSTQVVNTAVLGVGAAERLGKVRWQVFYDIALAWALTLPVTMLVAILLYRPVAGLLLILQR
ncbi:MAG: inorganic phosphate transporter [Chloroflexota bacterium]